MEEIHSNQDFWKLSAQAELHQLHCPLGNAQHFPKGNAETNELIQHSRPVHGIENTGAHNCTLKLSPVEYHSFVIDTVSSCNSGR